MEVTTDAAGLATFDVTLDAATTADELVSATATDWNGNTSEFSDFNLVRVAPIADLFTSESGAQATFGVTLALQPTDSVTIALSSSDPTEGTVSPASFTFTPTNWNIPQTATITGVDDDLADGSIAYSIITEPAVSADPRFVGYDADNVAVVNLDNDFAQARPVEPLGSLVYQSSLDSRIPAPGHTETYSLLLDPGQTLTVRVDPATLFLRPTIQVYGPDGTLVASTTASTPGANRPRPDPAHTRPDRR